MSYSFPRRHIFEGAGQRQLYESEWFQKVIGFILYSNETIKGKTIADINNISPAVEKLYIFLCKLETIISEVPPEKQGSRFGNIAFRAWLDQVRNLVVPFLEDLIESSGVYPSGYSQQNYSTYVQEQLDLYPELYMSANNSNTHSPVGSFPSPISPPNMYETTSKPLIINGKVINTAPPSNLGAFTGVRPGAVSPTVDISITQQNTSHSCSLVQELQGYFIDSFGSYRRIDYGTGHELTFASFLTALVESKLLSLEEAPAIVLLVFAKYVHLSRLLQRVYMLEPAGSKGVWGLDDYQFLCFVWGSAQFTTPIHQKGCLLGSVSALPPIGPHKISSPSDLYSIKDIFSNNDVLRPLASKAFYCPHDPDVSSLASKSLPITMAQRNQGVVGKTVLEKTRNSPGLLMVDAIIYVNVSKTGQLDIHSPTLYSLSNVPSWLMINQGLMRMFGGELLMKYPVIQHILFGSLLKYDACNSDTPNTGTDNNTSVKESVDKTQTENNLESNQKNGTELRSELPPLPLLHQVFGIKL